MGEKLPLREIPAYSVAPGESEADTLAADQAGPGKQISLYFTLSLADSGTRAEEDEEGGKEGAVVDSNFGKAPASFCWADGSLLPGFEAAVRGMRAGESREVLLTAEQAFGQINEDNIQRFPRYRFPADLPLEKGLMVSFADSAGNEQAGMVVDMDKRNVQVDFNHPLAGRKILFRVEILSVEKR